MKSIKIDNEKNPNFFKALKNVLSENMLEYYMDEITTKGNKTEKKNNLIENRKIIKSLDSLFDNSVEVVINFNSERTETKETKVKAESKDIKEKTEIK